MVNCNPETVSTDYDTSDRLYFEPLTLEDVLEIVDKEKPRRRDRAVRRPDAAEAGARPGGRRRADHRHLARHRSTSPKTASASRSCCTSSDLRSRRTAPRAPRRRRCELAQEIGYPLVVRPSYVLGGRAMEIVHEQRDLERYMREAVKVSQRLAGAARPLPRTTRSRSTSTASATASDVLIGGVMEHIEQAGVHSGDSACSLPPYSLSQATDQDELKRQTALMARALNVVGLMNVQFAIQEKDGKDVDLRAGGEPARLAHRAVRVARRPASRWPRSPRAAWSASRWTQQGITQRGDAALLQRQGSGVPVRQVPGRGHHPRPGDEVDRRGHGRGQDLRRGLRQEPARRRHRACRRPGTVFITVKNSDKPRAVEGGARRCTSSASSSSPPRAPPRRSPPPACRCTAVNKVTKAGRTWST